MKPIIKCLSVCKFVLWYPPVLLCAPTAPLDQKLVALALDVLVHNAINKPFLFNFRGNHWSRLRQFLGG